MLALLLDDAGTCARDDAGAGAGAGTCRLREQIMTQKAINSITSVTAADTRYDSVRLHPAARAMPCSCLVSRVPCPAHASCLISHALLMPRVSRLMPSHVGAKEVRTGVEADHLARDDRDAQLAVEPGGQLPF